MASSKSEQLSLRMSPQAKALLRVAAEREHRSASNMVEHLVLAYCEQHGIVILERPASNALSPQKGSEQ